MVGTRFHCQYPGCPGVPGKEPPFFGTIKCPSGEGHDLVCGPQVTVDAILEHRGRIVLIKRAKGGVAAETWALPGGFVNFRERLVDAVVREATEETGLEAAQVRFFEVYDDPKRDMADSRNNVSLVYTAIGIGSLKLTPDEKGRYEVAAARCFTYEEIRDKEFRPCPGNAGPGAWLAVVAPGMGISLDDLDQGKFEIGFDHEEILRDYLRRMRTGDPGAIPY